MKWVFEKITEYTGVTDQAEIEEIYGHMCDSVRTFNGLASAQLRKEAREAKEINDYLKTPAGKAYWVALEVEMTA